MKKSSTIQLELNYSDSDFASEKFKSADHIAIDKPSGSQETLDPPKITPYSEVYAATSRLAGRINAASVSEEEYNNLLVERQTLLDKKFSDEITRKEENRLEYVRWSLDRIEDAKYGSSLDVLESSVAGYEQFLSDIVRLEGQLSEVRARRKK